MTSPSGLPVFEDFHWSRGFLGWRGMLATVIFVSVCGGGGLAYGSGGIWLATGPSQRVADGARDAILGA